MQTNRFMIGDIIKAIYTKDDSLYYLIISVSETTQSYKAIHLVSDRETTLHFLAAHTQYKYGC